MGIAHTLRTPRPHAKPQVCRAAGASLEVASIGVMGMATEKQNLKQIFEDYKYVIEKESEDVI